MSEDLDGKLPKQELLLKILNMTTSDNDNTALVAIRRANEFLAKNKWDWEKLINSKIRIAADPFAGLSVPKTSNRPAPPPPDKPRATQPQQPWQPQPRPTVKPQPQPKPAAPPRPPRTVNATLTNRYSDWCWCCGSPIDVGAGWCFDPQDYNNSASSQGKLKCICHSCNGHIAASAVPSKAAIRRRQMVGGATPSLGDL